MLHSRVDAAFVQSQLGIPAALKPPTMTTIGEQVVERMDGWKKSNSEHDDMFIVCAVFWCQMIKTMS